MLKIFEVWGNPRNFMAVSLVPRPYHASWRKNIVRWHGHLYYCWVTGDCDSCDTSELVRSVQRVMNVHDMYVRVHKKSTNLYCGIPLWHLHTPPVRLIAAQDGAEAGEHC